MRLGSPAFEDEGDIPARFTCDGEDVSPPLRIDELPTGTVTLVLTMDDPDASAGTWDHWVAYDIEPLAEIPEAVGSLGVAGTNSWGRTGYGGPCPPRGTHRYRFTVYALDTALDWDPGADKAGVLGAIHGHVLDEATLVGYYARG
jgi:Raf kinase inhibitor-like YbhB/YbcL family protein